MKHIRFIYFLGLLIMFMTACKDDENPSARELILAHSWKVDQYDVTASTGTVGLSQSVLEPFTDLILEEAPLNGVVTFLDDNSFVVDDQGVEISGTWSLENNDADIIMNFPGLGQSYTFSIDRIATDNFDVTYVSEETLSISGFPAPIEVEFKIKSFLIPA